jgi:3-phytase
MTLSRSRWIAVAVVAAAWAASCANPGTPGTSAGEPRQPVLATDPVGHDADDPAIWVAPNDAAESLIIGTDKIESDGALVVFGLDGKIRQTIDGLDRPNNVDVEYGLPFGGAPVDIAVTTERMRHRLRVFAVTGGRLADIAPDGIPVLEGQTGEAAEPMGIALYRRPSDGTVFAIVAPKTGGPDDYLWQYRLDDDGAGRVRGALVRRFGAFSGAGEIEAVAVDDELGYVYYADERFGIRKYRADPDAPDAARQLGVLGTEGYLGDREGLAIYDAGAATGVLLSSDQVPGGSRVMVYPREGLPDRPHEQPRLATIPTTADATDGLEATSRPLPGFPHGLLIMMNSRGRNFLVFRWENIEAALAGRHVTFGDAAGLSR